MKVSAFIRKSAKRNDTDSQATIYFRLRDKGKDLKAASELTINPNHWNPEKQGYKDRVVLISDEKKIKLNDEIQNIISLITNSYNENVNAEWLNEMLDKYLHPNKYKTAEQIAQE
jgi:predicted oxidoreductase